MSIKYQPISSRDTVVCTQGLIRSPLQPGVVLRSIPGSFCPRPPYPINMALPEGEGTIGGRKPPALAHKS